MVRTHYVARSYIRSARLISDEVYRIEKWNIS